MVTRLPSSMDIQIQQSYNTESISLIQPFNNWKSACKVFADSMKKKHQFLLNVINIEVL